jgi:hypothetical protein
VINPVAIPTNRLVTVAPQIHADDHNMAMAVVNDLSNIFTGWGPTDRATKAEYLTSRGPGLITNGSGLLGTNYNFTVFSTVTIDRPPGAALVFQAPTGNGPRVNDEFFAVDPARFYDMSFAMRQAAGDGTRRFYSLISPYDVSKNVISPSDYMEQANTRTTLAAQLNIGATTITLTSSANWNNAAGASTHLRNLIFWDYTDATGYLWPAGTYSRNRVNDAYADGGISGNVITLRVPWPGPVKAAGTQISNGSDGGNFMYGASNVLGPATWTNYSYRYGGVHTNNLIAATTRFPVMTAYAKLGFLTHYPPSPPDATSIQRFANINVLAAQPFYGTPTIVLNANNGGSPPAVTLEAGSDDMAGGVIFGSGTSPNGGTQMSMTFSQPLISGLLPRAVMVTPANVTTAPKQPYVVTITATGFEIGLAVAPAASQGGTVYRVRYNVIV